MTTEDDDKRVITWKGIKALGIDLSRPHVTQRLEKQGKFPKGFKLGTHTNSRRVWWRREVIAWLEAHASS